MARLSQDYGEGKGYDTAKHSSAGIGFDLHRLLLNDPEAVRHG